MQLLLSSLVIEFFENAQFSLAAYANLWLGMDIGQYEAALKQDGQGLSAKQATNFANTYDVVTQYNDTLAEGGQGTGLSATVFRDKATGKLSLAIRGTELADTRDLNTDAWMIASGVAYDQLVSLYNWWKRETTAAGVQVQQFQLVSSSSNPQAVKLGDTLWLEPAATASGTSKLLGASGLEVSGHSLGGHLAMAFSTLFAGVVAQTTVFNAPGFKDTAINQTFFAALGGTIPMVGDTLITNVIADEATGQEGLA